MARTLDELRDEVMALSADDRSVLADDLLDSLHTAEDRAFVEEHLEEWEHRAEELRSGKVKGIPLEDIVREVMAKYGGAGRATS